MKKYDLIIIGAGPAGLTAALYSARAKLQVAIIEKEAPGGKLSKTATIENWPGIDKIAGVDLALSFFNQISNYDVDFFSDEVLQITATNDEKQVITKSTTYLTSNILIATGLVEKKLNIPGEQKFFGRGVSYCAVCDGALYENKVVAVIGGGNSALEEALYLTKFASKVVLIHRRADFRADEIIIQQVKAHSKIELLLNAIPVAIEGDEVVDSIIIKHVLNDKEHIIKVAAVFPFIGQEPATDFAKKLNIVNLNGYIITDDNMATKIKGIYAAGDVREKKLRQIVTATNDGAIAATNISKHENN